MYNMGDVAKIADLETLFGRVINIALGLAGIVLFVMLLLGGFSYITSGGDPKAAEGARKTITSAMIGLIAILVSYLILVFITKITGVDVTKFNIMLQQ